MAGEAMTRVLVSKESLSIEESGGFRRQYGVFQEDKENVIFNVPEAEAERFAAKVGGLLDLSE